LLGLKGEGGKVFEIDSVIGFDNKAPGAVMSEMLNEVMKPGRIFPRLAGIVIWGVSDR
jgi:hypothetical protein